MSREFVITRRRRGFSGECAPLESKLSEIRELLEQGERFSFDNFALKSVRGYPNALSDEWLYWTHRVSVLVGTLEEASPATQSIVDGLNVRLLGNGEDRFLEASGRIISGLRATERIAKNFPAADRTVSLDHNSQSYREAVERLDELTRSVQQLNDYRDREDKEQRIAELTSGRMLLSATRVRAAALWAVLNAPLRWLAEKFSGAIVGQLAAALFKALQYPVGF
jgi:hypothetical protein